MVIVGAGFGGLAAAKGLRESPVDVEIVDANNFHLFQPLLYQVATAGLDGDDVCYAVRGIVARQRNADVRLGRVTAVDLDARQLELERQRQAYVTQQKEIARLEEAVRRFRHWAHIRVNERAARQARVKQMQIDRMEKVERPVFERRRMALALRSGARGGQRSSSRHADRGDWGLAAGSGPCRGWRPGRCRRRRRAPARSGWL